MNFTGDKARVIKRQATVRPQETKPEGDAVSNMQEQTEQFVQSAPRTVYRLTRAQIRLIRRQVEKRREAARQAEVSSATQADVESTANARASPESCPEALRTARKEAPKPEEFINLRKTASTRAKSIAEIPLGATVLILQGSGKLYKAEYDSLTGYVNKKYVKPVPTARVRKVVKCSSYISLREEPAGDSARLDKLFKGTLVEYLSDAGNGYTRVQYENKIGFALTKYLKTQE